MPIDDLTELGYEVGIAFRRDDFTIYRVTAPWLTTQVRGDDAAMIANLADPALHQARVDAWENPPPLEPPAPGPVYEALDALTLLDPSDPSLTSAQIAEKVNETIAVVKGALAPPAAEEVP
jgi:hypothetical protein